MGQPKLGKIKVIKLLFLSIITLGVYQWVWIRKLWPDMNSILKGTQLRTPDTIRDSGLGLSVIRAILVLVGILLGENGYAGLQIPKLVIGLFLLIIYLMVCFDYRRVLEQFSKSKGSKESYSRFLTFFFTIYYVQYKINRLLDA